MQSEEEIGGGGNMSDTNVGVEDVGENLEAGSGMQLDVAIPAQGDADMSGLGSPSSPRKRKRHGRFPASGCRLLGQDESNGDSRMRRRNMVARNMENAPFQRATCGCPSSITDSQANLIE